MTVPAEHPERSTKVVVPESQVVCVAFPGHVSNSERALELFGGADVVSNTLKQPHAPLKCRPRRADGFSHPIYSSVAASNRLLLQVKKFAGADGSVAFQVSTVARIATTHEFSGPADFQVVSSTLKPIPMETIPATDPNSPLTAEPTRRAHPLLCLPPMFTRSDATFPYRYRAFMRRTTRSELQWLPKSKVATVAWEDATPPVPNPEDPSFLKVQLDSPGVVGAVRGLFDERPGWLLPAMHDRLTHGSTATGTFQKAAVDAALACMAYRFSQGAFQGVMFQKGFDPRKCADAWALQALPCALPDTWKGSPVQHALEAAAAYTGTVWQPPPETPRASLAPLATTYAQLVTLRHIPPSKMSFVQVCDVWDDERVCAPLWGAIGAPPKSQPRWGPKAAAAGTPENPTAAPATSTHPTPPDAATDTHRGALEQSGDTDMHAQASIGASGVGDASASTSAAGAGGDAGGAGVGDGDRNLDGAAGQGTQSAQGSQVAKKCLEHSGWFFRGAWDASCQRMSRVLCSMLPTAMPGTRKVFSSHISSITDAGAGGSTGGAGGGGDSHPGAAPPGGSNDKNASNGTGDAQNNKGGAKRQNRLGALPTRGRQSPAAAERAQGAGLDSRTAPGAGPGVHSLTRSGSGGAVGGFQDQAEAEVRDAQAAAGGGSGSAAELGNTIWQGRGVEGGGVAWQDAFVQISRQIREENASENADITETRPESGAAQLGRAVAALELEAEQDRDGEMTDV